MNIEKYLGLSGKDFIIKTSERYSKRIKRIDDGEKFLQLFDYGAVINEEQLVAAYINASNSFDKKTNISKSLGMEIMLFAAMTKQIGDAISISGAKEGKRFVIFSNSVELYRKIEPMLKEAKDFEQSQKSQEETATKYGIKGDIKIGVLEKMAASRL